MKPPNEKGALLHAPIPKSATPHYQHVAVAQACFPSWQREAARLLTLYSRTGNPKHLVALAVHVEGIRARLQRERT